MEVDPQEAGFETIPVNLWCFLGKEGAKKVKADLEIKDLTLNSLKEFVCRIIGLNSPNDVDLLYNGGMLKNDEAVKSAKFRPLNVITAIKINRGQEKVQDVASASNNIQSQVHQIALALRTAFLNPKFMSMVIKLGQTEMLENIMAIAPGLQDDPIGVAMIQDPTVIFHLSDYESLKKLAITRPWVVEAFNFMAASIHQEKGQGSSRRSEAAHALLMLGDGEDDMEEETDDEGPNNRITREQLSSALNSLNALGRGPLGASSSSSTPTVARTGSGSATGSSLFDLFSQPGLTPTSGNNPGSNTTDIGRMLSEAVRAGASAGGAGSALTPEMVARAMRTALNTLSPGDREAGFNELRGRIAHIQGIGSDASLPATTTPTPPTQQVNVPPVASTRNTRYAQQLSQMRDMGVSDERLSVMALRVSDGDVNTAIDLVLSGWTGEGADEEMPDEE